MIQKTTRTVMLQIRLTPTEKYAWSEHAQRDGYAQLGVWTRSMVRAALRKRRGQKPLLP